MYCCIDVCTISTDAAVYCCWFTAGYNIISYIHTLYHILQRTAVVHRERGNEHHNQLTDKKNRVARQHRLDCSLRHDKNTKFRVNAVLPSGCYGRVEFCFRRASSDREQRASEDAVQKPAGMRLLVAGRRHLAGAQQTAMEDMIGCNHDNNKMTGEGGVALVGWARAPGLGVCLPTSPVALGG